VIARALALSAIVVVAGACSDTGIMLTIERGSVAVDQVKIAVSRQLGGNEDVIETGPCRRRRAS
jgi:hypothetical protein